VQATGAIFAFGTVVSWCRPWFNVAFDDGRTVNMRRHEIAPLLLFSPADFFDPRLFFYDFGELNPLHVPGWLAGLRGFLEQFGVLMPRQWLEPAAPAGGAALAGPSSVEDYRAAVSDGAQAYLLELSGESRSARTLGNLRHAAFKALWWFASMGRALPPAPEDVAEYLAFLAKIVDTIGSVEDARGAIGFLAVVNAGRGWDRECILGGRAKIPLEALRRRHAHIVRKAPGLPASAVRAILGKYAFTRGDLTWDFQWRLAIGATIGAAFKLMARYADMRVVRYDDGAFTDHGTHIRIYVSERKTHVYGGQWIDIARPADGSFGVYHALLVGKSVFREGYVMPHIDKDGRVHRNRPMEYHDFVDHLRTALVHIGYPLEVAYEFSAHSMRSGAATEMVHSGLPPLLACTVAGVKSIDWLVGYMRADLGDRLRASWSIGL
jgi:hypothetical protein